MNEVETTTNLPKPKRKKTLTEMQALFLHHLANDAKGNVRKAMELAGYSSGTRPVDVTKPLKDEIVEVANDILAAHGVRAVLGLVEVIDNPGQMGANNKVAAAKELLDRIGVLKKDVSSQHTVKIDNLFILPAKDKPKVIDLDTNEFQEIE